MWFQENVSARPHVYVVDLGGSPFVQGPPGTGKTQTILGLLSVVLHASPLAQEGGAVAQLGPRAPLSWEHKWAAWTAASPWMHATNPRDLELPLDGDDGAGYLPSPGGVSTRELDLSDCSGERGPIFVCLKR